MNLLNSSALLKVWISRPVSWNVTTEDLLTSTCTHPHSSVFCLTCKFTKMPHSCISLAFKTIYNSTQTNLLTKSSLKRHPLALPPLKSAQFAFWLWLPQPQFNPDLWDSSNAQQIGHDRKRRKDNSTAETGAETRKTRTNTAVQRLKANPQGVYCTLKVSGFLHFKSTLMD